MQIWLISRTDPVSWDEYDSHVAVAETSERARVMAGMEPGDEGADVWLDAATKCTPIGTALDGEDERIILSSYKPGY